MPGVRMTDRWLESVKADKQTEYLDLGCEGLYLRVGPKKKVWMVRPTVEGAKVRPRVKLGIYPALGLHTAREKASTAVRLAKLGQDPRQIKRETGTLEPLSFGALVTAYREKELPTLSPTTQVQWGYIFESQILPRLAGFHFPAAADSDTVRAFRRTIRDAVDAIAVDAPSTAEKFWVVTRRVLSWSLEKDRIDPLWGAIFENFERPKAGKSRDRVLTPAEIGRVWWLGVMAEGPLDQLFWRLAFLSGQRKTEILTAKWEAIDFKEDIWNLTTKGAKAFQLPISRQIREAIEEVALFRKHSPWVIPSPNLKEPRASVARSLERVVKASGVQFRTHDLRRTFATQLAELQVDPHIMSRCLNHAIAAESGAAAVTMNVYNQHRYREEVRAAFQLWADRFNKILVEQKATIDKEQGRATPKQRKKPAA